MNSELKKDFLEIIDRIEKGKLGEPNGAVVILNRDLGDGGRRVSLCSLGEGIDNKEMLAEIMAGALGRHIRDLRGEGEDAAIEFNKTIGHLVGAIMGLATNDDETEMTITATMVLAMLICKRAECCEKHRDEAIKFFKDALAMAVRDMWPSYNQKYELEQAEGEGETRH